MIRSGIRECTGPQLPKTVLLGEAITAGAQLSGGEVGLQVNHGDPEFVLILNESQVQQIPPDAMIEIPFEDLTWSAVVVSTTEGEYGGVVELRLAAADGSEVVCGDECGRLPTSEGLSLLSRVQIVPDQSGPAVPVAAVRTDAVGATYLQRPDGSRVSVEVLGVGDGIAIVEGIDVGEEIIIFEGGLTPADVDLIEQEDSDGGAASPNAERTSSENGDSPNGGD